MRNQVQLIGNIGIDPEITNFESGAKKVRFTLATNERYVDKNGQRQDKTFWHNIHAWGPTANYIAKSGKKGTQLAITGKLVTRKYLSKTGVSKSFTSIEVKNAVALS
ncbi:single-stranded DNA-binding protein [Brumimicrobium oceani]|uniref:Single-stranded DNA-binding protein n=1 Tax=Brumimicrobium oceani TaxID=2100725 RepID=A0A2U2XAB4_9FLAO|nr:single-stranded DNA-binding protein [Brumimicrobium oceani]PWH84722.1 single-stranded DNA-binding protein [Brumimicrobium oceani]